MIETSSSTDIANLVPGSNAPDVSLATTQDQRIALSAIWQRGPVLLYFLRHIACSVCTGHAIELAHHREALHAAGIQVALVLALDAPAADLFSKVRHIPFLVLADSEMVAYRAFGLTSPTNTFAPSFAKRLEQRYGPELPKPPVSPVQGGLVGIDQKGVVRYSYASRFIEPFPQVESYIASLQAIPAR